MKIYRKKVLPLCEETVETLIRGGDIELNEGIIAQVARELSSIFDEYNQLVKLTIDETKSIMERENLPPEDFSRIKKMLAGQRGLKLEDEAMEYLADKMILYFMTEDTIEEVYSDDPTIRKKIFDIMKKYMAADDEVDTEVRARLKNISENSPAWKIEYNRVKNEIMRKKGLV